MKVVVVCCCFLAIGILKVRSRPANQKVLPVEIESVLDEKQGNGTIYAHILTDGSFVRHQTYTKQVDGAVIVVQEGEFSFIGADKLRHKTTYISDENGYRAKVSTTNKTEFVEDNIDPKVLASLLG